LKGINSFKSVPIVGYILILLNVSQFMTIIPSIFFGNEDWYVHQTIILVFNILFLVRHKIRFDIFQPIKKSVVYVALMVLCLIFILELPRFLTNNEGRNLLLTVLNAIEFVTFFYILSDVFYEVAVKRGFKAAHMGLIKIYVLFSCFIVLTAVTIFMLASLGVIRPHDYPMPPNLSMNVASNARDLGTEYFFPLHLTVVTSDDRGLPFFSNFGVFCGLSHEPHIATYLVTPAFFFMFALDWSKKAKYILSIFFIFFMLMATSTTNLIAFAVVLFFLIIINIKNRHDTLLNIVFLGLIIAFLSFAFINDLGVSAIQTKLDASSGTSLDYSKNFLSHVVSPKGFWGDGAFNVPFPNAGVKDIGILFSILCIGFYVLLLIGSVRLLFSPARVIKLMGAGSLYFLLHTLKVVQLSLIYPFTIFIMFYMLIGYMAMKGKIYKTD